MEETIGIQLLRLGLGLVCFFSVPALNWFMRWAEGYRMYRGMDLAKCRIKAQEEEKAQQREEMKDEYYNHIDWSIPDEEEDAPRRIKVDATLFEDINI